MKASKKRGFTIIELVIVIAVIAILAAVLIPTFANIIQKANVANDVALARNMNTILIADEATNGRSTDMYDVLIALEQGGFKLENLNPRADGNVFAWDKANNQIVYLDKKNPAKPIFQAKEIGDNKGDLYIILRRARQKFLQITRDTVTTLQATSAVTLLWTKVPALTPVSLLLKETFL